MKPWGIAFGDETQSIENSGYGVCTIIMNGLRKGKSCLRCLCLVDFCQNASAVYYVGYGLGFERTICEAFKCQVRS